VLHFGIFCVIYVNNCGIVRMFFNSTDNLKSACVCACVRACECVCVCVCIDVDDVDDDVSDF